MSKPCYPHMLSVAHKETMERCSQVLFDKTKSPNWHLEEKKHWKSSTQSLQIDQNLWLQIPCGNVVWPLAGANLPCVTTVRWIVVDSDHPPFISGHSDHHTSSWPSSPEAWIMPNIPANTRIIKCCIPCEPPKLIIGQEQASIVRCVASENKTFQGKIAPNRFALKVGLKWVGKIKRGRWPTRVVEGLVRAAGSLSFASCRVNFRSPLLRCVVLMQTCFHPRAGGQHSGCWLV